MLPSGSSSSSDYVSSNAFISLLIAGSASYFLLLHLALLLDDFSQFIKHSVCYGHAPVIRNCVISDGILLYGYISMGGHIMPDAENANTASMVALARPLSTSYMFLTPLLAKTFPVFEINWKLDFSSLKILVEP
jgi:hypothetical protein